MALTMYIAAFWSTT